MKQFKGLDVPMANKLTLQHQRKDACRSSLCMVECYKCIYAEQHIKQYAEMLGREDEL